MASDLKHMSEGQLRQEVSRLSRRRADLLAEAMMLEDKAAELTERAGNNRRQYHNLGQRESWARTYLARKEAG